MPITGSPATFVVTGSGNTDQVNAGSSNDNAESLIRKHLPYSMAGKAWSALIAALSVGDQYNWDNARAAFDQLFKTSASSFYLDRLSSDDGLVRPPGVGMSDDLFRKLSVRATTAQLTQEALLEILEVYYGPDSVRSSLISSQAEPYLLSDGDDLQLMLDGKSVISVTFRASDFLLISSAKAIEVSAAITRYMKLNGSKGFASVYVDPATGYNKVRIYSGSLGLGSSVQVTGGRAQLGLQMPTALTTYTGTVTSGDSYNWVVTIPAGTNTNKVSLTTTGLLKVDLSVVRPGDYVVFQAANSTIPAATYQILEVDVAYSGTNPTQSFYISGNVAGHSFLQLANSDMTFFRPTKATNFVGTNRSVLVSQSQESGLAIVIPATSQAVARTKNTAAYLHTPKSTSTNSLSRVGSMASMTLASSIGLSVGSWFLLDGSYSSPSVPSMTAGNGTSTTNASVATIWSQVPALAGTHPAKDSAVVGLPNGKVLVMGGHYPAPSDTYLDQVSLFSVTSSTTTGGATQYTYSWSAVATPGVTRAYWRASVMTDAVNTGNVFLSGGYDGTSSYGAAWIYNGSTWSAVASSGVGRCRHSQVVLSNGRILIAGGATDPTGTTVRNTTSVYNPLAGFFSTWTTGPNMLTGRYRHRAVTLANGQVLFIGGMSQGNNYLNTCEITDVTGYGSISATGSMTYARVDFNALLLPDGRVLVHGGTGYLAGLAGAVAAPLRDAEIYDPKTGCWYPAGRSSLARTEGGSQYLPSKGMVLFGGGGQTQCEYWNPVDFSFKFCPQSPASSTDAQYSQSIGLVTDPTTGNTLALLTGGAKSDSTLIASFLYSPGEEVFCSGQMTGLYKVNSIDSLGTTVTFTTPASGLNYPVSGTVTAMSAQPGGAQLGPYALYPNGGVPVTAVATSLAQSIDAGRQYQTIDVEDASSFPDSPGWLCIGFGTSSQLWPVRYLGKNSSKQLRIDYNYSFPVSNRISAFTVSSAARAAGSTVLTLVLPAGVTNHGIVAQQSVYFKSSDVNFAAQPVTVTSVTSTTVTYADSGSTTTDSNPGILVVSSPSVVLLSQKSAFSPNSAASLNPLYATASSAGRIAAQQIVTDSAAAGVNLQVSVQYPSDVGLGNAGQPVAGLSKISDSVEVWGGDNLDEELAIARGEIDV